MPSLRDWEMFFGLSFCYRYFVPDGTESDHWLLITDHYFLITDYK